MTAWRHGRRRAVVWLLVALLHAAWLLHWARQAPPGSDARAPARVAVRLLARAVPPSPAPPPAPAPAPRAQASRAPAGPPRATRVPRVAPAAIPLPGPADDSPRTEAAATPASGAEPTLHLDPEATARAIREVARQPGLAARAGRVGSPERGPEQRLGEGIAQGARGDCLKGEYAGAGMGVLSLPFLAAAALRDRCRH